MTIDEIKNLTEQEVSQLDQDQLALEGLEESKPNMVAIVAASVAGAIILGLLTGVIQNSVAGVVDKAPAGLRGILSSIATFPSLSRRGGFSKRTLDGYKLRDIRNILLIKKQVFLPDYNVEATVTDVDIYDNLVVDITSFGRFAIERIYPAGDNLATAQMSKASLCLEGFDIESQSSIRFCLR